MTVGILTEKPSAARKFATALGGTSGNFEGTDYKIVSARGHLYEFAEPHEMVKDPSLESKYKLWDLQNLPWDPQELDWHLVPIKDTKDLLTSLRRDLGSCDEIVIATDVDPTGEGGMIAGNIISELGLESKQLSRMYFTDEEASSLQKAFRSRMQIASLASFDEYQKARYRAMLDMLTIQFTRVATTMARESGRDLVLRNGRLKSADVKLVGDQLKAHNDYVRKPFFQNRFKDENGVVYTNPEEPRFDAADQVPSSYSSSPVVKDSATMKSTAPPKLLDLASLSTQLQGKGVKAKLVLSTYQKMYEAGVVSYPRTDDKTITPAQFDELAPKVDRIAALVGVDPALLTHRTARTTHVKSQGAHGANRPGPNVPDSLQSLESTYGVTGRLIYETLGRNYLAMLAEDYTYEQQKGHLETYPAFLGQTNVPKEQGWKLVFDPDAGEEPEEDAEQEAVSGLGTSADPFVHEGANVRPEHPSMRWLMKQLAKRDVGTGATRTSTYAEITNEKAKYPLLIEKGRKLTLAEAGDLNWRLLPDTHIGNLTLTEQVYANMRAVADGSASADQLLGDVAGWVREDIETMQRNADTLRSELGLTKTPVTARATGVWQAHPEGPQKVSFKRIYSSHEFTDEEIQKLLAGEEITFDAVSKQDKPYVATGSLGLNTFKGRVYVGFVRKMPDKPTQWCSHTFTDDEVTALLAGQKLKIDDFVSARTKKTFSAEVTWDADQHRIIPDFGNPDAPPKSWCNHEFTDAEYKKLVAGQKVKASDFVSSKTKKRFEATVQWKEEKGRKKLVPSFGK
ncbi:DNA topoisomerase [Kocuria palustris]|uniref:DNA topoisomerase n=1 Tax=Kocuria palustris TaxID=71999 RepID=UPI000738DC3A|nr:DNA topoisomerase [Kocuria palustris]KUG54838.1 DNA topoisomerase I [Kocuria palustris]